MSTPQRCVAPTTVSWVGQSPLLIVSSPLQGSLEGSQVMDLRDDSFPTGETSSSAFDKENSSCVPLTHPFLHPPTPPHRQLLGCAGTTCAVEARSVSVPLSHQCSSDAASLMRYHSSAARSTSEPHRDEDVSTQPAAGESRPRFSFILPNVSLTRCGHDASDDAVEPQLEFGLCERSSSGGNVSPSVALSVYEGDGALATETSTTLLPDEPVQPALEKMTDKQRDAYASADVSASTTAASPAALEYVEAFRASVDKTRQSILHRLSGRPGEDVIVSEPSLTMLPSNNAAAVFKPTTVPSNSGDSAAAWSTRTLNTRERRRSLMPARIAAAVEAGAAEFLEWTSRMHHVASDTTKTPWTKLQETLERAVARRLTASASGVRGDVAPEEQRALPLRTLLIAACSVILRSGSSSASRLAAGGTEMPPTAVVFDAVIEGYQQWATRNSRKRHRVEDDDEDDDVFPPSLDDVVRSVSVDSVSPFVAVLERKSHNGTCVAPRFYPSSTTAGVHDDTDYVRVHLRAGEYDMHRTTPCCVDAFLSAIAQIGCTSDS